MNEQPKKQYDHYFSVNFVYRSDIDPDEAGLDEKVNMRLQVEMRRWAVDVINHGSWSVEWFDSEEADDA